MRPVLSPDEARRLDVSAADPVEVLMERAGLAVALEAVAMGAGYGDRVTVLAGSGNNGGDGYVAARHLLRRGVAVEVLALSPPAGETAAQRAAESAAAAGVPIRPLRDPHGTTLLIDAVFGIGFRGRLPDVVAAWTDVHVPVLAVDVPSGLDAATGAVDGPSFTATRTVTLHALKPGLVLGEGPDRCGLIRVADIGLSGGEPVFCIADAGDAPRPVRARTAHKWSVGSVLVVGGGRGTTGAALLAAQGALHAGAGAVAIAAPAAAQAIYAALSADVLTIGLGNGTEADADPGAVTALGERFDALVLGPGLGASAPGFVDAVASQWPGPLVLDADGLNGLSAPSLLAVRRAPTVLTPHAGEFRRLTGAEPSVDEAERLAHSAGAIALLKGNPTIVAGANETWVVDRGGPELATIGTGDVLAGMIGAHLAAGMPPLVAARSAAYHHGEAGRRLLLQTGMFTAGELATEIGR